MLALKDAFVFPPNSLLFVRGLPSTLQRTTSRPKASTRNDIDSISTPHGPRRENPYLPSDSREFGRAQVEYRPRTRFDLRENLAQYCVIAMTHSAARGAPQRELPCGSRRVSTSRAASGHLARFRTRLRAATSLRQVEVHGPRKLVILHELVRCRTDLAHPATYVPRDG